MNSIRIEYYKEQYLPKVASRVSFSLSEGIKFIFWNLSTLGRVASCSMIIKSRKIQVLHSFKMSLEADANLILQRGERLEKEVKELRARIKPTTHLPNRASHEVEVLQVSYKKLIEECSAVRNVNETIYYRPNLFFDNVLSFLTLGAYAVYRNHLADKNISALEGECESLKKVISLDLKKKIKSLDADLSQIASQIHGLTSIQAIQQLDVPQTQLEIEGLLNAKELFNRLTEDSLNLSGHYHQLASSVLELNQRIYGIQEEISRVQLLVNEIPHLQASRAILLETEAKIELIQKTLEKCGPLPARYARRPADGNVSGAPGINEEDDEKNEVIVTDENGAYAKKANSQKTALSMVELCLEEGFQLLKKKILTGYPFQEKLTAFISKKFELSHFDDLKQRAALYRYAALFMIQQGSLCQAGADRVDCHGAYISLNKDGEIRLYSTKPVRVQTKMIDKATGKEICSSKIIATNGNEFTPKLEEIPNGIDPLSIKWIWAQLSKEEQGYLEELILTPLIQDDRLEWVSKTLEGLSFERAHLIKTARLLIAEMGQALELNFIR
jgi:hypothetical protein